MRHVGDVDRNAPPVAAGANERDRVVEVLGRGRVDGHHACVAEIASSRDLGGRGLAASDFFCFGLNNRGELRLDSPFANQQKDREALVLLRSQDLDERANQRIVGRLRPSADLDDDPGAVGDLVLSESPMNLDQPVDLFALRRDDRDSAGSAKTAHDAPVGVAKHALDPALGSAAMAIPQNRDANLIAVKRRRA